MDKSRIVQSCYVSKTMNGGELSHRTPLNIKKLYQILEVLIDEGFENYNVVFGYDSNCAYAEIFNDFDISNDTIWFSE